MATYKDFSIFFVFINWFSLFWPFLDFSSGHRLHLGSGCFVLAIVYVVMAEKFYEPKVWWLLIKRDWRQRFKIEGMWTTDRMFFICPPSVSSTLTIIKIAFSFYWSFSYCESIVVQLWFNCELIFHWNMFRSFLRMNNHSHFPLYWKDFVIIKEPSNKISVTKSEFEKWRKLQLWATKTLLSLELTSNTPPNL